jgi:predicted metal-dependent hydrolase
MERIIYETVVSTRAKHLRISVAPDGAVAVTVPSKRPSLFFRTFSNADIDAWVESKREWIICVQVAFAKKRERREKQALRSPRIRLPKLRRGTRAYNTAREEARRIITERLAHFNTFYHFTYGTISIRDQKTRWGSCSAIGNLAFNFRIVHIAPELADYLVVHELCHIKHHNHSAEFWAEVARTVPDYIYKRKELKRYSY